MQGPGKVFSSGSFGCLTVEVLHSVMETTARFVSWSLLTDAVSSGIVPLLSSSKNTTTLGLRGPALLASDSQLESLTCGMMRKLSAG